MSRGRARIVMAQGISIWVLEAPDGFGDADVHAHHAIQISVCLEGALALGDAGGMLSGRCLAVAADARHRFEARGLLAFLFVEPESRAGRAIAARLFGERAVVPVEAAALAAALEPLRATFEDRLGDEALVGAAQAAVEALAPAGAAAGRLPDPRVQRIIDHANANLDRPLSLADPGHGVHLSPSRLRHLFVEQTGLAFKTYLLWLRLVRAVREYGRGSSLTEAAHAAGFSDSAHFSRVFRRTFGLPATTLTRFQPLRSSAAGAGAANRRSSTPHEGA